MTDCREALKVLNAAIVKFNNACADENSDKLCACQKLHATIKEIGVTAEPCQ